MDEEWIKKKNEEKKQVKSRTRAINTKRIIEKKEKNTKKIMKEKKLKNREDLKRREANTIPLLGSLRAD